MSLNHAEVYYDLRRQLLYPPRSFCAWHCPLSPGHGFWDRIALASSYLEASAEPEIRETVGSLLKRVTQFPSGRRRWRATRGAPWWSAAHQASLSPDRFSNREGFFRIRIFPRSELKKPGIARQRLNQKLAGIPVEHFDDTVGQGVEPVQADGVVIRGKPFAPNTERDGGLVLRG